MIQIQRAESAVQIEVVGKGFLQALYCVLRKRQEWRNEIGKEDILDRGKVPVRCKETQSRYWVKYVPTLNRNKYLHLRRVIKDSSSSCYLG